MVNYAKVYYACGRCDATSTKEGKKVKEYGPCSVSRTLVKMDVSEHDPKIEVEEVRLDVRGHFLYSFQSVAVSSLLTFPDYLICGF